MQSEAAAMQSALEGVWERLYAELDDARFERRADLILALYPPFPIPQCNGPWVVEDTQSAVDGMAGAIAEVEAAGAWPWVQTRSGHERARRAAAELGLTHSEQVPGMVLQPGELVEPAGVGIEIDLVTSTEVDAANEILATSFGAPKELFDRFYAVCAAIDDASWYVGRVEGEVVGTALGMDVDGVSGVFNVATAPEHRGRGYGAALTARVVRDGFHRGVKLAFLQSSDIGHGVYRRLGFRDVEEYLLMTRPAPAEPPQNDLPAERGVQPASSLSLGLEDGASYANAHLSDWARLGRIARAHTAAEVVAIVGESAGQPDGVDDPVAYWSGFVHGVGRVVRAAADGARP